MPKAIADLYKAQKQMDAFDFYELYRKQTEATKLAWNRFACNF